MGAPGDQEKSGCSQRELKQAVWFERLALPTGENIARQGGENISSGGGEDPPDLLRTSTEDCQICFRAKDASGGAALRCYRPSQSLSHNVPWHAIPGSFDIIDKLIGE
jgi:hypothetical protein